MGVPKSKISALSQLSTVQASASHITMGPMRHEVVRPEHVYMGIAFPFTAQEYQRALHNPQNRDFIPHMAPVFPEYERFIMAPMQRLLPEYQSRGVHVKTQFSLEDWGNYCSGGDYRVIILVAHHDGGLVEFAEGLVPIDVLVSKFPKHFRGVVDLSICNPDTLIPKLRDRASEVVCAWNDDAIAPVVFLQLYRLVFLKLQQQSMTYLEAVEEAIYEIAKIKSNDNRREKKWLEVLKEKFLGSS